MLAHGAARKKAVAASRIVLLGYQQTGNCSSFIAAVYGGFFRE